MSVAFWVGIAITTATVVISFIWTQKTLRIRLAFGSRFSWRRLSGGSIFCRSEEEAEMLKCWEVTRLNAFALHFIGGDLQDYTELNNIIGAYIHNQNGKVIWDCNSASIEAYTKAVNFDPKFPFSYFYRASCNRLNNSDQWQKTRTPHKGFSASRRKYQDTTKITTKS